MKKNNNKLKRNILLLVWVILLITLPYFVTKIEQNINKQNGSYISSDFEIENYNVVLDVDKTNKVDVTETITINIPEDDFNGIYKSIPLWEEYYDTNFKTNKKKISITNLRAIGEKFVLSKSGSGMGIRIGSSRTNTSKGLHTYTIKYRYNMGKDLNKTFDNFVFKVFDNYDDTKINNMSVIINMPKEFDETSIMFLKGKENINKNINYTINGNSIFINLDDYLLDDSLTINMTLQNGYFVGITNNYGLLCLFICLAIIVISIISVISWKKYGKNLEKRSRTVELYPPDELDAAQIGYIYGETSVKKLTAALIIQLASKGYISINEVEKKKYEIKKLGNADSKKLSITEQIVYLELFKNGDVNLLSNDASFPKVFEKVSACLENTIDKKVNDIDSRKTMNKIFILLFVSIIAWIVAYLYIRDLNPNYDILYKISLIAIFITGFFSIFMNRRTAYGEIIYAKVSGFKDYLITAEKNQLDYLVEENANYFYDILPYTYILNISDKWIKTFDKNNVPNIDLNALDFYEDGLFMFMSE